MIDVLKRLAELDAKNSNVVKENTTVQECGMMGMPPEQHHAPASINMTADSGSELTGMLRDIMQLAGVKQVGPQDLGVEHEPMSLAVEPITAVGPAIAEPLGAVDDMRAVLDKLNPEPASDDELGPFQHDSDEKSASAPFDQDDHDAEGDAEDDEDDEEETDEGQYDNSPADAEPTEPFDANEFAHQENQPGAGDDESGKKRVATQPSATFESLMKQYKDFIGESADDEEDMDEAVEKKETTWTDKSGKKHPATQVKGDKYTGKEAEKDEKKVKESADDILKLAGLR